jgi:hypothetical protein
MSGDVIRVCDLKMRCRATGLTWSETSTRRIKRLMRERLNLSYKRVSLRFTLGSSNKYVNEISAFTRVLSSVISQQKVVMFFDECSFSSSSFKRMSWGLIGQTCLIRTFQRFSSLTMLSTMTLKGPHAFMFVEGGVTGNLVTRFVRQVLQQYETEFDRPLSDLVIVMDNVGTHLVK